MEENKNEIILFENLGVKLEVNLKDETVRLTQNQQSELFGKAKFTVNEHLKNIYKEGELIEKETMTKFGNYEFADIEYEINGNPKYCMPNTINICFACVSSEALMLSTKQYCGISNGLACNSKSYKPSYVLSGMGIPVEKIENLVRISWGSNFEVGVSVFLRAHFERAKTGDSALSNTAQPWSGATGDIKKQLSFR